MAKQYKEGDLVLCIVRDVVKTTVFVETEDKIPGSINFSEVAPGRIRNIRDYVVPNKIIVCKILDASQNHLFLSIRRVKGKEKEELLSQYKKVKSIESFIKKVLIEKGEKIIETIRENENIMEFFEEAKQKTELLEKYFTKEEIEKIKPIFKEKKEKEVDIKKGFNLSCKESDGILRIKRILSSYEGINYLGSSAFMIKIKSNNPKQTTSLINQMIEQIEKQAKKEKCEFSTKK
ncbi:MAG: hypothetical protein WC796_01820 [Candidatus Pacearchaeota archaeon]|jgi:translation initiation factor 2 alpha subunit (eIF-2alpha)